MSSKEHSAVVLFSGGLDSRLALRLVFDQGIACRAMHFTSEFLSEDQNGEEHPASKWPERALGIEVTEKDITEELIELIMDPDHGHGSGLNACID